MAASVFGIGGEILRRVVDDRAEPVRRCREADIDSQVDQAFGDVAISVVVKIVNWFVQSARVIMDRVGKSLSQLRVAGPVQVHVARVQSLPTDSRRVGRDSRSAHRQPAMQRQSSRSARASCDEIRDRSAGCPATARS